MRKYHESLIENTIERDRGIKRLNIPTKGNNTKLPVFRTHKTQKDATYAVRWKSLQKSIWNLGTPRGSTEIISEKILNITSEEIPYMKSKMP